MGKFVNPDNSAFQNALNAEIYVDKTGLVEVTNRFLETPQTLFLFLSIGMQIIILHWWLS